MSPRIPREIAEQVECLYREVAPDLFKYACVLTRGDIGHAEDVVHEAFQAAALGWTALGPRTPEDRRRWLFAVAFNKAVDAQRRMRPVAPLTELHDCLVSPASDVFGQVLDSALLAECWAAIKAMPPVRHQVALLRWWAEWSPREIAEGLGIAQSTVRGHLKAARDELRNLVVSALRVTDDPEDFWALRRLITELPIDATGLSSQKYRRPNRPPVPQLAASPPRIAEGSSDNV